MLPPKFDYDETVRLIQSNTEKVVMLPWNGTYIPFIIRMLNSTQLRSCGDFSVVNIADEKDGVVIDKDNFKNVVELKNTQENMLRRALVSPTLDEINDTLETSKLIEDIKNKIKTNREKIAKAKDLTNAQRLELSNELNDLELYMGYLYPDDFVAAFITYITQKNNTDIDKITKTILLEAAIAADNWSGRPSDYLEGVLQNIRKLISTKRLS